jgi:hypothetical protein
MELRIGLGGPRYYIAGRPVPGGSVVQMCFSGGWVTGRFEWSGDCAERPRFHCSLEVEQGGVVEHSLEIPEGALMRWAEGLPRWCWLWR